MIIRARSNPIEIFAIRWDGSAACLIKINKFVGYEPTMMNHVDGVLGIWNILEHQNVNCPIGHYIIKGLKGKFYPCDPQVFEQKYTIL